MIQHRNDINIWKNTFDDQVWTNKEKINELLIQVNQMELFAKRFLQQVEKDFPFLTDHSIVHSNILWEYADIIIGDKPKYLNPLEGFILNSVFLLHDAGMCYSILNNKENIKNDPIYLDYIYSNKGKTLNKELEDEAIFYCVRQNHGEYALQIAIELLNDEEFFIANADYRQEFGEIIGKIAKSHTCNINFLEREFGHFYSSPKFPKAWTIDMKKLAFILRVADAADLDNLRTPKTLKMIEEIKGSSKDHWTFQKKIGLPNLESNGHLVYTTNNPFSKQEQKAWWYCYDALKVLDNELKIANTYFTSENKESFSAKSVKYIDDTLTLGQNSIKTSGWDSIDTTVRVSNPVHIALELGGKKLYGDKSVAIRELMQNSIDAIHVHRILTGQNNLAVGKIRVKLTKIEEDYFLEISDNGIGMSQSLMTNELLDFGGSYWKTRKFDNELRGLKSKGFEAIGKFGIGFFSVFMLGNCLTVTSWKYGEGIDSMRTLDFYDGLFSNPIIRQPTIEEKNSIIDRGTTVKIKLAEDPSKRNGILKTRNYNSLKSLVKYYIPSADIEIAIQEVDGSEVILQPNSLDKLNCLELIDYLNVSLEKAPYEEKDFIKLLKTIPFKLIEIEQDGKIIGKLSPLPEEFENDHYTTAVVISNGIRVSIIEEMIGYICSDEVISIRRDQAVNVISFESLKTWAIKQIIHLESLESNEYVKKLIKDLQITFGLHDDTFLLVKTKINNVYNELSILEFKRYVEKQTEINFYEEAEKESKRELNLNGFSNIFYGINLEDIILNQDLEKANNSEKIIRQIIKDAWGEYKLTNNGFEKVEDYYVHKWTFKKEVMSV